MSRTHSLTFLFILALTALPFTSLAQQMKTTPEVAAVRDAIYKVHGAEKWWQKELVHMDIKVTFGGNTLLDGKFYFDPQLGKVRMEMADGSVVIYKEAKVWAKAGDGVKVNPGMRFHVLTWPWFAASPFKMKHSYLNPHQSLPLTDDNPQKYAVIKQTFAADAGDSPDDWYLIYKYPKDNTMAAQAYIVTYSKDQKQAEEKPSIIVYEDNKDIDGVKLSETWQFYFWNKDKGTIGPKKGHAKVSGYKFSKMDAKLFEPGKDYVEINPPK